MARLRARPGPKEAALLPIAAEGLIAALLIVVGALPAGASGALSVAVFPADAFFDLKASLSTGTGWSWVLAALLFSALVRGLALAATLWLLQGRRQPFARLWGRASILVAIAWVAFLPTVALIIAGSALRYAPLIGVGAVLGVATSVLLARRAVRLAPDGKGSGASPSASQWLGYAYLVAVTAAAREWLLVHSARPVVALFVLVVAPIHALVLVRWVSGAGGRAARRKPIALALTIVVVVLFLGSAEFDRHLSDPKPAAALRTSPLYLLGGADSTSRSGALSGLDVRSLGWRRRAAVTLSYRGRGRRYRSRDTHQDLGRVARLVGKQIVSKKGRVPGALFGHSQAALIVDRMLDAGVPVPDHVVVVSPPLPYPPTADLPRPKQEGRGDPARAVVQALEAVFKVLHIPRYGIQAPAAPTNLEALVVQPGPVQRLAVWALGDSVWLDRDWRRPGEVNVVALSDHVGAVKDARTIEEARRFFADRPVSSDGRTWRGFLVNAIRYTFQPWRP
jgi:hypothetical protein